MTVFRLFGRGEFLQAAATAETLLHNTMHAPGPLDKLEVCRCYLRFLILFMKFERDGQWDCSAINVLLAELQIPLNTELGNHERILTIIQLLTNSGDDCGCPMDEADLIELLDSEHLLFRDRELWLSVSRWAFVRGYIIPLERSFEYFSSNNNYRLSDKVWKRVNLMLKLLRGNAIRLDVANYVDSLRLVPQIMEFREDILPVIRDHFLWDEGMEQKMLSRLAQAGRNDDPFEENINPSRA